MNLEVDNAEVNVMESIHVNNPKRQGKVEGKSK